MRRALPCLLSVLAAAVPAGCGRPHSAPVSSDAKGASAPPSVAAPAQEVAPAFRPPADGRLTTTAIERYLAVHKRAAELASSVKLDGGKGAADAVAQIATADLRAARELGYDPGEYRWVRGQIAEALGTSAPSMDVKGLLAGLQTATVESLETRRAESKDEGERARLSQEIARLRETSAAGTPKTPPATVEENRKLLEPFRAQLGPVDPAAVPDLPKAALPAKP